jgi:hypothetical protein
MVNNLYYSSGSYKSVGLNHSYCLYSVSRYEGHIHDKEYTNFFDALNQFVNPAYKFTTPITKIIIQKNYSGPNYE